jgi:RNA polymerase sigma-70 factor (ECF subfamily)
MPDSRLSKIETQWSLIHRANEVEQGATVAQTELFERYSPAIKRYLLASLRSEEAANEVFQEFALRLIRGDFKNADCEKGKFRSMIKTSLYRLMIDFHRRTKKRKKLGTAEQIDMVAANELDDSDTDSFTIAWRQTMLDQAWDRLEQLQTETSKPYFTILRARVDSPELTTKQLHESLRENQPIRIPAEASFRVYLHRARKRFAKLLTEQVALSIQNPTPEDIEAELIDLGLHQFCRP